EFIFYVPNLLNDGHDAANPTVDASLKSLVPPLLASPWYAAGGTVIVAYDEDEGQGVFAHVVVSQNARSHAAYSGNLYGDLRTIPNVALKAGVATTISFSRAITTSDPVGSWYAFGTYQTSDGAWHDGASLPFSVTAAGATPPPPASSPAVAFADVGGNNWW